MNLNPLLKFLQVTGNEIKKLATKKFSVYLGFIVCVPLFCFIAGGASVYRYSKSELGSLRDNIESARKESKTLADTNRDLREELDRNQHLLNEQRKLLTDIQGTTSALRDLTDASLTSIGEIRGIVGEFEETTSTIRDLNSQSSKSFEDLRRLFKTIREQIKELENLAHRGFSG